MKVIVDLDLCQGHAQCEMVAPEVFRVNDDGFADVLMESPPESLYAKVKEAVMLCPADAIRIVDD